MAIFGDSCPRDPTDFNSKTLKALDKKTNNAFLIDLHIEELVGYDEMMEDMKDGTKQKFTYVLVYSTPTWLPQILQWIFSGPRHCVYIKTLIPEDQNNPWIAYCYNSHANNPYFGVELNKPDNLFYKVSCEAKQDGTNNFILSK